MNQTFIVQQARARGQAFREHNDGSSAFMMAQARSRISVQSRSSRGSVDSPTTSNAPQIWWDDRRIMETVNDAFLQRSIGDEKLRAKLNSPIMEGLSDTTFAEWILGKARRFFLILLELGEVAKLFDLVESSWDDTDLPLDSEQVSRLGLRDVSVEKRFLRRQYAFLVRDLDKGAHINYDASETIPIEPLKTGITVGINNSAEKFVFPRTQQVVIRKTVSLSDHVREEEFQSTIHYLKELTHHHIVGLYASYTLGDDGYLLFAPATELTLKAFFQTPPTIYKSLSKEGKRRQIFDWMHCLSDAITFLYERGIVHRDLRPKSILIDGATIFLADTGVSQKLDIGNKPATSHDKPNYEYAAPEIYRRSLTRQETVRNVIYSGRAVSRRGSHDSTATAMQDMHVVDWVQSTEDQIKRSDIFSLACVFLEIITFLQGKHSMKDFASHRAAKNRRGARGARGALADQSFHANLEQVSTWIAMITKEADRKKDENVKRAASLCSEMLFKEPTQRPEPWVIRDRLFVMTEEECTPNVPHCGNDSYRTDRVFSFGDWGSTMDEIVHTPVTDYGGSPGKQGLFGWFRVEE